MDNRIQVAASGNNYVTAGYITVTGDIQGVYAHHNQQGLLDFGSAFNPEIQTLTPLSGGASGTHYEYPYFCRVSYVSAVANYGWPSGSNCFPFGGK